MKISAMIERLGELKEAHGDIEVNHIDSIEAEDGDGGTEIYITNPPICEDCGEEI